MMLSFILGMRIPFVPYVVAQWRRDHPGEEIPDGHIFTQPWPATAEGRRDRTVYYQYKADRTRRTMRGIDQQVAQTGWSIRRFVRTARRYRTIEIQCLPSSSEMIAKRALAAHITPPRPQSTDCRHRAPPDREHRPARRQL